MAGSSNELPRVRAVMDELRRAGIMVTYDWTIEVERNGTGSPEGITDKERRLSASMDLRAIDDSDVTLFLNSPGHPSRGMHVELGYALSCQGFGRKLIWSGPNEHIFPCLCDRFFPDDNAAVRYMVETYGRTS